MSGLLSYQVEVLQTAKAPDTKNFSLKDNSVDLTGRRILVIDDVLTTGESTLNVVRLLAATTAAQVVGICVVVDRQNATAEQLGVPVYQSLVTIKAKSYDVPKFGPQACPLCMSNVHICDEPGFKHGIKYVAEHGQPNFIEDGN